MTKKQKLNYLNVELNIQSEDPDSFANVFMDLVTRNTGVYNRAVAKAIQLSDEDFLYFYGEAVSSIEEGVAPIEGEKIDPVDYTLKEPIDVTDVSDPTEFNEIEWIVSEELEAPIEAKNPELVPSVEKIKSPNEVSEKPKDIVKPKEIVFPDELEFLDLDIKNPNVVTKPNESTSLELIELPDKPGKAGSIQKVNEPEKPKDKINPVKPVDPTNPGEETEPKENITVNNSQKSNEQKVNLELEKNQLKIPDTLPKTGEVASVITSVSGLLSVLGGLWLFRKRK